MTGTQQTNDDRQLLTTPQQLKKATKEQTFHQERSQDQKFTHPPACRLQTRDWPWSGGMSPHSSPNSQCSSWDLGYYLKPLHKVKKTNRHKDLGIYKHIKHSSHTPEKESMKSGKGYKTFCCWKTLSLKPSRERKVRALPKLQQWR